MAPSAGPGLRFSLARLLSGVAIVAVLCGLARAAMRTAAADRAEALGIWLTALVPLVVLHFALRRRSARRGPRW